MTLGVPAPKNIHVTVPQLAHPPRDGNASEAWLLGYESHQLTDCSRLSAFSKLSFSRCDRHEDVNGWAGTRRGLLARLTQDCLHAKKSLATTLATLYSARKNVQQQDSNRHDNSTSSLNCPYYIYHAHKTSAATRHSHRQRLWCDR